MARRRPAAGGSGMSGDASPPPPVRSSAPAGPSARPPPARSSGPAGPSSLPRADAYARAVLLRVLADQDDADGPHKRTRHSATRGGPDDGNAGVGATGVASRPRSTAADVVVISDDEDTFPLEDSVTPPAAPTSTVGTHLQTAEERLCASPLGAFAGPQAEQVQGMPWAPMPVGLQLPLPVTPDGALVAEVCLVVDDREIVRVGPTRDAFLSRLRVNPGLASRVQRRRFPTGDAVLVARVTAAGEAAVAGAPRAGTEIFLDQLIERMTAADMVASLRDGRLRQQKYYMVATGCNGLVFIVEGDLDAATENDANVREEAKNVLAGLTVSSNFVFKYSAEITETAAFFCSLVCIRGRRLGNAAGFSSWLATTRANNRNAAGVGRLLTFPLWDEAVATMQRTITLQQISALPLNVLPVIGRQRINRIIDGDFSLRAALQDAYRAAGTEDEAKTLSARLKPAPGRAPVNKELPQFVHVLFTMVEYVTR